MEDIGQLLARIHATADCTVRPPAGLPRLREQDRLPADLEALYRLCGGVRLFERSEYAMQIVGPQDFVRSNPVIALSEAPEDITDTWYIVARAGGAEAISIDCAPSRLGRCSDSFWDSHGVAGSCRVLALTFTEMLARLLRSAGQHWFWLGDDAPDYGDAYD